MQDVIAPRRVGLYPLPPVLAWGSTPAEVGLALSRRLIEEQVPPGEARQDAMATLRVFARTAHPVEVVDRIRGRGPAMIDSPVFADFIEEGRAMGRQEGRLERLRDDILAVLEARFGQGAGGSGDPGRAVGRPGARVRPASPGGAGREPRGLRSGTGCDPTRARVAQYLTMALGAV